MTTRQLRLRLRIAESSLRRLLCDLGSTWFAIRMIEGELNKEEEPEGPVFDAVPTKTGMADLDWNI